MPSHWWYVSKEKRRVQVDEGALRDLLIAGAITNRTLVWNEDLADWKVLEEVEQLAPVVQQVPPPLPTVSEKDAAIALPLAGPWRRFFARFIDLFTISVALGFGVGWILGKWIPPFFAWISKPVLISTES